MSVYMRVNRVLHGIGNVWVVAFLTEMLAGGTQGTRRLWCFVGRQCSPAGVLVTERRHI